MPHAVLLTGPRGIGKATLAYRFARFVLACGATGGRRRAGRRTTICWPCLPIAAYFAGSPPAGMPICSLSSVPIDPRRRRLRSEIVVDDTREIAAFLRLTAAEGGWRVVIVDGADEMNRSAANALLKILEEPPRRALLLLVAHSPGRLLPTIRSRCRRFPMTPLPPSIVSRLLETYRPDLPPAAIRRSDRLGGWQHRASARTRGSRRGRAVSSDPGAAVGRAGRRSRGAACVGRPAGAREADDAYRAVEELLSHLLGEIAVGAAGGSSGRQSCPESDRVLRRLGARAPAARWAELREQIAATLPAATRSISTGNRQSSAPSLRSSGLRARSRLPAVARVAPSGTAALLDRDQLRSHICGLGGHHDCRPAVFSDHADLLRQRPAASRSRLHDRGLRRAGAIHAARRAERPVSDRHRRARPEGRALGAGARPHAAAICRSRSPARSATWDAF